MIGDDIIITIIDVDRNKCRVGIKAPKHVTIHREEVYHKVRKEKESNSGKSQS